MAHLSEETKKGRGKRRVKISDSESNTNNPPKKRRAPFREIGNDFLDDVSTQAEEDRTKTKIQHNDKKLGSIDATTRQSNYLKCSQYADSMYKNHCYGELCDRPTPDYMKKVQSDITPKMRALLVDWMVQVCDGYSFSYDTLYLAVYLVDRFLTKRKIVNEQLVLLGTSCIVIASKYEEWQFSPVSVGQICIRTKCNKAEVLKMETEVLSVVCYRISVPTVHTFLRRFLQLVQAPSKSELALGLLACYLADLTLLEYRFLKWMPSDIAASAVLLAKWTLDQSSHPWNENLRESSGIDSGDLKGCVLQLRRLQQKIKGSECKSIYLKYEKKLGELLLSVPELPDSLFC